MENNYTINQMLAQLFIFQVANTKLSNTTAEIVKSLSEEIKN